QYSDDGFVDVEYGIHGGFKGGGFAETSIRRSRFLRNTKAGVALGNFNALDIWIWDSLFEDCDTGVTNTSGAGNFHVYRSVFRRSARSDLAMGNTGGFSARGNYSTGSKAFFTGESTNNPATIDIEGNTIVDPIDAAAREIQDAIVAAARQNGARPVVHIPYGMYSIFEPLTVPASDIQIAGDGYGTILRWTGAVAGPVIRLSGPSKVTLREIQFDGVGHADGIVVDNVDQPGSRVYMGQAELRSGKRTNLFVNGLDSTNVQLEDIGYAYSPDAVSIKVAGGPLA